MKKIVILGAPWCKFCNAAKDFATDWGLNFTYLNVDDRPDLKDFLKAGGFETIPQIFIDGNHIGGAQNFEAHIKTYHGANV